MQAPQGDSPVDIAGTGKYCRLPIARGVGALWLPLAWGRDCHCCQRNGRGIAVDASGMEGGSPLALEQLGGGSPSTPATQGRGACQCHQLGEGIADDASVTGWGALMMPPAGGIAVNSVATERGIAANAGTKSNKSEDFFVNTKIDLRLDYKTFDLPFAQYQFYE